MLGMGLGIWEGGGAASQDIAFSASYLWNKAQPGTVIVQPDSMIYQSSGGFFEWSAPNELRHTWQSRSGTIRPLGIEAWTEVRTQLLLNTSSMGLMGTANNVRVIANPNTPDQLYVNSTGAFLIACNTVDGVSHVLTAAQAMTTSTDYTVQIWLKNTSPTSKTLAPHAVFFRMQEGGAVFNEVRFDVYSGQFESAITTNSSVVTASMEVREDGWCLCWYSFNSRGSASVTWHLYVLEPSTRLRAWTTASDGAGIWALWPQTVVGLQPQRTYRPNGPYDTAADDIQVSGIASFHTANQFVVDFERTDDVTSHFATAAFVANSALDNLLTIGVSSDALATVSVFSDAATAQATGTASWDSVGRARIAVALEANSFAAHVDQTVVLSDNAGVMPAFDNIHLGGEADGDNPLRGYIRSLNIARGRPTNAVNSANSDM